MEAKFQGNDLKILFKICQIFKYVHETPKLCFLSFISFCYFTFSLINVLVNVDIDMSEIPIEIQKYIHIAKKKNSYLLADIKRATAERRTNKFQRLV